MSDEGIDWTHYHLTNIEGQLESIADSLEKIVRHLTARVVYEDSCAIRDADLTWRYSNRPKEDTDES